MRVSAEDYFVIDHYSVNDTRFTMNADGWLTSVIQLQAGTYPVLVSVFDSHGNVNTMTIEVIVQGGGIPSDMFLILMVGAFTIIVVGGFIVILLIRRRTAGGYD